MEKDEWDYGIKTKEYEYWNYTDFQQFITVYTKYYGEYRFVRRWNLKKTWTTNFVEYKNLTICGINRFKNNWSLYLPLDDRKIFISRKIGYYTYGFSTLETIKRAGLKPYDLWIDHPLGAISFAGESIDIPEKEKNQDIIEQNEQLTENKPYQSLTDDEKKLAETVMGKIIQDNIVKYNEIRDKNLFKEQIKDYILSEMSKQKSYYKTEEFDSIDWDVELSDTISALNSTVFDDFIADEQVLSFVKNELTTQKVLELNPEFEIYKDQIDFDLFVKDYCESFEPYFFWREYREGDDDSIFDEIRHMIEREIYLLEKQKIIDEKVNTIIEILNQYSAKDFYKKYEIEPEKIYCFKVFDAKFIEELKFLKENTIAKYKDLMGYNYIDDTLKEADLKDFDLLRKNIEHLWMIINVEDSIENFFNETKSTLMRLVFQDKLKHFFVSLCSNDKKELILYIDDDKEKLFSGANIQTNLKGKELVEYDFYNLMLNNMKEEMYSKKTGKLLPSFLAMDKIIEYGKEVVCALIDNGIVQENEKELQFKNFDNIINFVQQAETSNFLITKMKKKRGA